MGLLFVYGTLRRGSPNAYAQRLEADAKWMGAAEIRGIVIAVGEHKGLRDGEGIVAGEAWDIPESLWPMLDDYEGPDYRRVEREITLRPSGERVPAQVYQAVREP